MLRFFVSLLHVFTGNVQIFLILALTLLALWKRNNHRLVRKIYIFSLLEIIFSAAYLAVVIFLVFKNGNELTKIYLTAESGYYGIIITRLALNTAAYLGISLIVLLAVHFIGKKRPFFRKDDAVLMALAGLAAVAGFYQSAIAVRMVFYTFFIQSLILIFSLIAAAFILGFVISSLRRTKGRFDVVPYLVVLAAGFAFPSAKIASWLGSLHL